MRRNTLAAWLDTLPRHVEASRALATAISSNDE
jgi:hypothetical protein